MPAIFLSYRRSDSQDVTGRIYDRLVARFTQKQVFKDVDNIPLGVSFPTHIKQVIGKARAVLVIIGPSWLHATDEQGRRRLDDPSDFVRLEVETALRAGMPVVPVLVSNTRMPLAGELPPSMQRLVSRNGMAVRPDPDFNHDMGRLFSALDHLEKLFNAQPGSLVKPPPPPKPVQIAQPANPVRAKKKKAAAVTPLKEGHSVEAPEVGDWKLFGLWCSHALWTGIVGAIAGLGLTALLFWLTLVGLLLFQKPVNNVPSRQGGPSPEWMESVQLVPPMPAVLLSRLEGPEGRRPGLGKCFAAVWDCIMVEETGTVLMAWLIVSACYGFMAGFSCRLLPRLLGGEWAKLLEALTIGLTLFAVVLLWTEPNAGGATRLGCYGTLVLSNLCWMTVQGFRFRSLVYLLAVILVGEFKGSTVPAEYPATALWYVYFFLSVPGVVAYLGSAEDPWGDVATVSRAHTGPDADGSPAERGSQEKPWPGLILLLVMLGVFGGAGTVLWKFVIATGGPGDDLRYLPDDCHFIASFNMEELLNCGPYRDLKREVPDIDKGLERQFEASGVSLTNLARVTVGGSFSGDDELVTIIRTKSTITAADLCSKGKISESHKNVKYEETKAGRFTIYQESFESDSLEGTRQTGQTFCVADGNTIVFGKSSVLRKILDRDRKPELSERMQRALKNGSVSRPVFAVFDFRAARARPSFEQAVKDAKVSLPGMDQLLGSTEAATLEGSFGSEVKLNAVLMCRDAGSAEESKKTMKGFLELLKIYLKGQGEALGEAGEMADSVKLSASGDKLTVSASIKAEVLIKGIKKLTPGKE